MITIERALARICDKVEETGTVTPQALLLACDRDFDIFARILDDGANLFSPDLWGRIVDAMGFQMILLCKILNNLPSRL